MHRCPHAVGHRRWTHLRHRGRPPAIADLDHINSALAALRDALRHLNAAAAHHAAWAVRRALKSTSGALRHATNVLHRSRPTTGAPITNQPLSPHGAASNDRSSL